MKYEKIKKEVSPEKYYSIREIAQKGWITPIAKGDSATCKYDYIAKLVRVGKLPSKDVGAGYTKPRYYVRGIDILDWGKIYN